MTEDQAAGPLPFPSYCAYRVDADLSHRDGRWFAAVRGLPTSVTEAARFDQVELEVTRFIANLFELDAATVVIHWHHHRA